uniref:WASH complex subunit CCDC53 n=1 Tax=Clastoptera arizonana TaxID=38151 RepID=A0A1B6CWU9_9HEMI
MSSQTNIGSISSLSTNINLSKIPSIHQKRLLTFVNHFIVTTVSFLNNFYESCESRLEKFDRQIQKLDSELSILEAKLNSIPGLEEFEIQVQPANPDELDKAMIETKIKESDNTQDTPSEKTEIVQEIEESSPPAKEHNPLLDVYKKMVHVGVPLQAVKLKMQRDGVDPSLIDS